MYKLLNGVERNAEHPTSFYIPTMEEKHEVTVGSFVKLGFEEEGTETERMWVKVTYNYGNSFRGELNNEPVGLSSVKLGDIVDFTSEHIIDILED